MLTGADSFVLYALSAVNIMLVVFISLRLELHKTGIFTLGFFNIFTALVPQFIWYPLVALATGDDLAQRPNFTGAMLMIFVMLTGLWLGMTTARSKKIPLYDRIHEFSVPIRTVLILFFLTAIGIVVLLSAFRGGLQLPHDLLQKARTPEFRLVYGEFELGYPLLFLQGAFYCLQVLLVVAFYKEQKSWRALFKALAITLLTGYVMLAYGSRNAFFVPIVLFLIVTHHFFRRIPISLVAVLFVATIPVFVFLRIFSTGHTFENLDAGGYFTNTEFIWEEFVARFAGFEEFVNFLDWFEGKPFAMGETIFQFFVRPIPRTLIPDKPSSIDVFLSYAIHGRPEFGGSVAIYGGLGEMYYNFWFIGILVWFFIVGNLIYRIHFGLLDMIAQRRYLAFSLVLSNFVLLRGLVNLGVNTSGMQQLIMAAVSEFAIYLFLAFLMGVPIFSRGGSLMRKTNTKQFVSASAPHQWESGK